MPHNYSKQRWTRQDLRFKDYEGANFTEAIITNSNLSGTNLKNTNFSKATLTNTNLSNADLSSAILDNAKLQNTNLHAANLRYTSFKNADLSNSLLMANLFNSDLTNANLEGAILNNSFLWKAKLTGCILNNTSHLNWIVLKVECDYIYLDSERKNRQPKSRNYKNTEFEKIFSIKPLIEIEFPDGMNPLDPVYFSIIENEIKKVRPDFGLELKSIEKKGFMPVVKFTHKDEVQGSKIENLVNKIFIELKNNKEYLTQAFNAVNNDNRKLLQETDSIKDKINKLPEILKLENISIKELEFLVSLIRRKQKLIEASQKIFSEKLGDFEYFLEMLNPYFKKAFNRTFETNDSKIVRTIMKECLSIIKGKIF